MLDKVATIARQRGCCKITLEVLQHNHQAKSVYQRAGFHVYQLDKQLGYAEFWHKSIQ